MKKKNRQIFMQEGKCTKNAYQKNISGLLQTFGHAAVRDWFKVHSQQF